MGRIIALLIAVAAAVAGWVIGEHFHHASNWWIGTGSWHACSIQWRAAFGVISSAVAWILALNILWPRR